MNSYPYTGYNAWPWPYGTTALLPTIKPPRLSPPVGWDPVGGFAKLGPYPVYPGFYPGM